MPSNAKLAGSGMNLAVEVDPDERVNVYSYTLPEPSVRANALVYARKSLRAFVKEPEPGVLRDPLLFRLKESMSSVPPVIPPLNPSGFHENTVVENAEPAVFRESVAEKLFEANALLPGAASGEMSTIK